MAGVGYFHDIGHIFGIIVDLRPIGDRPFFTKLAHSGFQFPARFSAVWRVSSDLVINTGALWVQSSSMKSYVTVD